MKKLFTPLALALLAIGAMSSAVHAAGAPAPARAAGPAAVTELKTLAGRFAPVALSADTARLSSAAESGNGAVSLSSYGRAGRTRSTPNRSFPIE